MLGDPPCEVESDAGADNSEHEGGHHTKWCSQVPARVTADGRADERVESGHGEAPRFMQGALDRRVARLLCTDTPVQAASVS